MSKTSNFIIFLLIVIAFNGCNNNKSSKIESNFTKSNTLNGDIKLINPKISEKNKSIEENRVLDKMGINSKNGKIIIEPNKTKRFFENVAKKLQNEAQKLQYKTQKLDINDFGIKKEKDKIVIDINKTKKQLEKISKDLEIILKDLEKVFK